MRRIMVLAAMVLFAAGVAVSYAQNKPETPVAVAPAMEHKGCAARSDKGMMDFPAMSRAVASSIVATSDGGVVVLVGNKIVKYDKNLNLVKEVTVEAAVQLMSQGMGMTKRSSCGSCANKMSTTGSPQMKSVVPAPEQKTSKPAQ